MPFLQSLKSANRCRPFRKSAAPLGRWELNGQHAGGAALSRENSTNSETWVSRISKDAYKIAIDTKGDGRPDIVKTYKDNAVVQIESDRNFDRTG